ncbi:MAG: hypothetical protein WCS94_19580 [Verrucomicrobiota bacterium]
MSRYTCLLMGFALLALSGCGSKPDREPLNKRASRSDTNVVLMLKAIEAIDRGALGFTPILPDTEIWVGESRPGCSQMLELYAGSQRTRRAIIFRKTEGGYRWIAEMETHYGPKMFRTFQGPAQEEIIVEYCTEPFDGIPTPNQIHVVYHGDDSRLTRRVLTYAEIQPFLEKWRGTPIK